MGLNLYSAEEEERIRLQTDVRDWTRAGLLEREQGERLAAGLRVDLRRTPVFLRAGLAMFTLLIVVASVALVGVSFRLNTEKEMAAAAAVAAVGCLGCANVLAGRFRFYRHGVEEMLAVAGVFLLGLSAGMLTDAASAPRATGHLPAVAAFAVGGAASFVVFLRFGFLYGALGAMAAATALPFQFRLEEPAARLLAVVVLAVAFGLARLQRARHERDYQAADFAAIEAVAFIGACLILNLYLSPAFSALYGAVEPVRWFKWLTYAVIWLLPAAGLWTSIRAKERELLDASMVALLVTIATNKPYLGWIRQTWDPIVFGVLLMVVALAVRRWLGLRGDRHGFTVDRLRARDLDVLRLAANVSAGVSPPRPTVSPGPPGFHGGGSGGGGADASF